MVSVYSVSVNSMILLGTDVLYEMLCKVCSVLV
jgi:hypothetical protein